MLWRSLLVVLLLSGCQTARERLCEEGYTNVREMPPLHPCPHEDPDMSWAFVAERDGLTWEIKLCCHQDFYSYGCVDFNGDPAICSGWRSDCRRYIEHLPTEEMP